MLKRLNTILVFLFVFSFSATLLGNESVDKYFPATLGSFWVYEDQDGKELTRRAIEGEEIAGETYHAFEYEPAFENWENYEYYVHPTLFKVDDTGIRFLIGDEVKKAYKERITKELKTSFENMRADVDFNRIPDVEVEVEAQDHFYMLVTPITPNEEWDTMRIKPTLKLMMALENAEVDAELAGYATGGTIYFTILETGIIAGKETVETPAGTFKDCLKIEYRTETVMPKLPGPDPDGPKAGESVSTLWLAPNIGIVKFRQEAERPIIQQGLPGSEPTTQVKTLELKKYEIKSDAAGAE